MIIDVHTHLGEHPHHISDRFLDLLQGGIDLVYHGDPPPHVRPWVTREQHLAAMRGVDRAIALGFQSLSKGFLVPNDYVAEYARAHPDKIVGFCSVDPNDPRAIDELERCFYDLGLKGIKMGPVYQDFDPMDERAVRVYERAEALGMTILMHQGATFIRTARLRIGMPIYLDEIGLRFPELRLIIAHMGHPWFLDTIALIRQRPYFYADISALYYRPWQFYNALVMAHEYNVTDKLLFGSDYPFLSPEATIEALRSVNRMAQGTLPRVPEDAIERIIGENAQRALGHLWAKVPSGA
jgi:predicted TIM-barrel fold metal-dependent hydrolase